MYIYIYVCIPISIYIYSSNTYTGCRSLQKQGLSSSKSAVPNSTLCSSSLKCRLGGCHWNYQIMRTKRTSPRIRKGRLTLNYYTCLQTRVFHNSRIPCRGLLCGLVSACVMRMSKTQITTNPIHTRCTIVAFAALKELPLKNNCTREKQMSGRYISPSLERFGEAPSRYGGCWFGFWMDRTVEESHGNLGRSHGQHSLQGDKRSVRPSARSRNLPVNDSCVTRLFRNSDHGPRKVSECGPKRRPKHKAQDKGASRNLVKPCKIT